MSNYDTELTNYLLANTDLLKDGETVWTSFHRARELWGLRNVIPNIDNELGWSDTLVNVLSEWIEDNDGGDFPYEKASVVRNLVIERDDGEVCGDIKYYFTTFTDLQNGVFCVLDNVVFSGSLSPSDVKVDKYVRVEKLDDIDNVVNEIIADFVADGFSVEEILD